MPSVTIHELPDEDKPREKLLKRGAGALSESELIAILLRTGTVGANAVDVARELLQKYRTLGALSRCTARELAQIKGIKLAKALQLNAAFELGKRLARETPEKRKMDTPEVIYELLGAEMRMLHKESLRVVLLDTRWNLMRVEEVSLGSLNESIAHPREIFRPALIYSAHSVVVVHNHPSGDPTPSAADIRMTRQLAEAAKLLQIRLVDHIILGAPSEKHPAYYSFKEGGLI